MAEGGFNSGFQHYLDFGEGEGRNPNADFDEAHYRNANPDVAAMADYVKVKTEK